jgi:hypothetical protein
MPVGHCESMYDDKKGGQYDGEYDKQKKTK